MKHVKYEDLTGADAAGVEFWGEEDAEHLSFTEIDDAIEYMLDSIGGLPATVDVIGYERGTIAANYFTAADVIERALEVLDEEYGDPEGCRTKPWPKLTQAAEAFMAELRSGYEVWRCSEVLRVTVQVRPWLQAHRPEWLDEVEGAQ